MEKDKRLESPTNEQVATVLFAQIIARYLYKYGSYKGNTKEQETGRLQPEPYQNDNEGIHQNEGL